jgi:hypothetical protein
MGDYMRIKTDLKRRGFRLDLIGPGPDAVARYCKSGSKTSKGIKCGNVFEPAERLSASQD